VTVLRFMELVVGRPQNILDIKFRVQSSKKGSFSEAREKARSIFRVLVQSPERDSILGDLGRIGRRTLKRKVRERARIVQSAIGEKFPDLEIVLDSAVDCRNRFVHGTDARLTYDQNLQLMAFFTHALKFVFAASDLAECGWDLKKRSDSPTGLEPVTPAV
jgi:hypothetical protein